MRAVRVQIAASRHLDEIYRYTRKQWGERQAVSYLDGLFSTFEQIAKGDVLSRPIPDDFGVQGFYCRYQKHYVYWKYLKNGDVGIVTVLHERMHQMAQFRRGAGQ
ncbi:MAG: type II toxin-antitoxin system RelE/ParE family toxin [Maricaulis sp.]|nr:type II toxin-antitoxin system RelE/ParE family toxin [Maricaulis sp.]